MIPLKSSQRICTISKDCYSFECSLRMYFFRFQSISHLIIHSQNMRHRLALSIVKIISEFAHLIFGFTRSIILIYRESTSMLFCILLLNLFSNSSLNKIIQICKLRKETIKLHRKLFLVE